MDFERECIHLPDSKTGQRVVYLSTPAIETLNRIERNNRAWVIQGKFNGKHLVNLEKPWSRIRERAGLSDVRLHDLRHFFASVGASGNMGLPILGKLLGHKQMTTTER